MTGDLVRRTTLIERVSTVITMGKAFVLPYGHDRTPESRSLAKYEYNFVMAASAQVSVSIYVIVLCALFEFWISRDGYEAVFEWWIGFMRGLFVRFHSSCFDREGGVGKICSNFMKLFHEFKS